jgi:hypothetical protein
VVLSEGVPSLDTDCSAAADVAFEVGPSEKSISGRSGIKPADLGPKVVPAPGGGGWYSGLPDGLGVDVEVVQGVLDLLGVGRGVRYQYMFDVVKVPVEVLRQAVEDRSVPVTAVRDVRGVGGDGGRHSGELDRCRRCGCRRPRPKWKRSVRVEAEAAVEAVSAGEQKR